MAAGRNCTTEFDSKQDARSISYDLLLRDVHPARREFERWCVAKERARLIAGPFRERRGAPRDGLALSKQRVFGVEEPCEHRGRRREGFVVPAAAEWAVRWGAEWGREGFDEGLEAGVHRTLVASLMMSEEEGEASEVTSDDLRTYVWAPCWERRDGEIWVGEGTHHEHRRHRGRFRHRIHDR